MPSVDSQKFLQTFQTTLAKGGRISAADLTALESAQRRLSQPREKAAANAVMAFLKHDRELDDFEKSPVKKALGVLAGVTGTRLPRELEKVLTHAVPQSNAKVKDYDLRFDFSKDAPDFPAKAVITLERAAGKSTILEVDPERLKITGVKANGKAVPFEVKDGRLHVTAPGAKAIEVDYRVKPQDVRGDAQSSAAYGLIRDKYAGRMWTLTWPYNTGALFPSNSMPADGSTSKVTVKVGAGTQALGTGYAEGNAFVTKAQAPAYAIAVYASKDFKIDEGGKSKDGVSVSSFGAGNAVSAAAREAYRKATLQSLDFFSQWLGQYDYGPTLKLVELQGGLGGMEHTSAVAIMLNAARDPEDAAMTAVHETAHHWFGDNVRIGTWGDFWMSEGFTNYATYRFYRASQGEQKFHALLDEAKGQVAGALGESPHALHAEAHTDVKEIFDSIPYEFGPWVLRMMEVKLGTPKFDAVLKDWFTTHRQKDVTTEKFIAFVKQKTGEDFTTFFKEWNAISKVPELDGEVKRTGSKATVTLEAEGACPKSIEIPLRLEGDDGKSKTVMVKPGQTLSVDAGFAIKRFTWDPERTVLADVH